MRARATTASIGIAEEADKLALDLHVVECEEWGISPLPRVNCGLGADVNPSKAKAQEAGAYPTIA